MDHETLVERAGPRAFDATSELTEKYRRQATRMLQFHANSEIMGAYMEKPYIRRAPGLDRKLAFSAKVQDELGHSQVLFRATELLGIKTREEMLAELRAGEGKFMNCAHYELDHWAETSMTSLLVDGAAMLRQATLKNSSWEPYAHAMDKICFEEGFHVRHGEDILRELVTGSKREQELAQWALDRWWPRTLMFFGPTDNESKHHDYMAEVGLKLETNDNLRQRFLEQFIPKLEAYGLEIPDSPRIRKRSDGTYTVIEDDLDWDHFWDVVRNEDEEGKAMIDARAKSKEAATWVSEILDEWETQQTARARVGGD